MSEILAWIAASATMIGALMTAANLGARVTGWGFAMFSVGSTSWIASGLLSNQPEPSVMVMHSVLLPVNLFGVWRWLGRHARYEDSREHASERSRWARVPTLFSGGALIGATVQGNGEMNRGKIVDAMFECDGKRMAYVVVSEGGVAGAGETLRAIPPRHLSFDKDEIRCDLTEQQWQSLPAIENDDWPTTAPPPADAR